MRDCPLGAYFSSQSATLPAGAATGNLTLRLHSLVQSIVYDENSGKATGGRVIDAETSKSLDFSAKVIFLNASTLGRYLMDHHFLIGTRGTTTEFSDRYYTGRRPNGIYVPRFRNDPKPFPGL